MHTPGEPLRSFDAFAQRVARVRARVLKINPDSRAPLKLLRAKPGEEGNLGLFANWRGRGLPLTGLPGHWRVVTLALRFRDRRGTTHNYVDFKGIGAPHEIHTSHARVLPKTFYRTPWFTRGKVHEQVFGLTRRSRALRDWRAAEWLAKGGVRTYTPVAVLELLELLGEHGERVPVEEARRRGLLTAGYTPVLFMRAHPEVLRVRDIYRWDPHEHTIPRAIYFSALQAYAKRAGFKSLEAYADWFTRRAAENLARIHNLGAAHRNYSLSNLTLDGRIVDHEGIIGPLFGRRANAEERALDLRMGLEAVYMLSSAAVSTSQEAEQVNFVKEQARHFLEHYLRKRKELAPREERGLARRLSRTASGQYYAREVDRVFEERAKRER